MGITVTYRTGQADEKALTLGMDYKESYSGNKKAGIAKLNVSFLGNYKGSKRKEKLAVFHTIFCVFNA